MIAPVLTSCVGKTRHNTCEDDDGDTVAKTAFRNLLTKPHQEHGSRDKGNDAGELEHETRIDYQARLGLKGRGNTESLEQTQEERRVTRVLSDLSSSGLSLFAESFERGHHVGQHLQNNGCRNVRHDTQREKREPRESATGEHVEQPENAALLLIEQLLEHIRINSRNRYVSTDPVYDERKREEHETLFQVRVLPLALLLSFTAVRHVLPLVKKLLCDHRRQPRWQPWHPSSP